MRLSCSTPYRENAIVNIARSAASHGDLQRFYTTIHSARWQKTALRVPLIGARLAAEAGRRAFRGIPDDRVVGAAALTEIRHIVHRRLGGERHPARAAARMYKVKAAFDAAVARRLKREPSDALVGMYAASLESFRTIQSCGGLAVLNFVNSHPVEHNRYLAELAGLSQTHHEMIPPWVAARVEAELELADLILVPSQFVARQLVAHGISEAKITTLPYGVDLQAFYPAESREAHDVAKMVECLYVGQISHRKGIPVLLEAARQCNGLPIRFRLIGPLVSREVLDRLPENVTYEGVSAPGSVAEAMRRVDLFVLPTIEDACALVVLEAMASGLPVITTTNNGSGELIEHGADGWIVPAGEATTLAEALSRLVEQPHLRHQLGRAARLKVQGAHSWNAYGHSVLEAIHAVDATRRSVQEIKGDR